MRCQVEDAGNELFTNVNSYKLKELVGAVEELLINKTRLEKISSETGYQEISEIVRQEIGITNHIQDIIKKISAVPVGILFSRVNESFSEAVTGMDKEINIAPYGYDVQVDNSLIKSLEKIILYFINGLYHKSIENTEERVKKDKPPTGQISLNASSNITDIVIAIRDDGAGIDIGNLHKESETTYISLSDIYSNTSGQSFFKSDFPGYNYPGGNIDIDVVMRDINILGGNITFEIEDRTISAIYINIPHSSSISQAMLVKVGKHNYALPISFIDKILRADSVSIKKNNKYDAIIYQDKIVPLVNTADRLEIDKSSCTGDCIIIVKVNDNYTGLRVDELQDQVDIVIKPKPPVIGHVKEFMGGAILGDGMVTLVFDVPSLVKS